MESRFNEEPRDRLAKYVRSNEVSLYRRSFPYILLLLGRKISFIILTSNSVNEVLLLYLYVFSNIVCLPPYVKPYGLREKRKGVGYNSPILILGVLRFYLFLAIIQRL